jgi:hypothetical protein
VTFEGLPGAVIWTEAGSRTEANREVRAVLPPDALMKLRIFVAARGVAGRRDDAAFAVRALDAEGGGDRIAVGFEGPER